MSNNFILLIFNIIFTIIIGIYTFFILFSYMEKKEKKMLYLMLIFVSQVIFLILQIIRYSSELITGETTTLSSFGLVFGFVFTLLSTVFALFFYGKFSELRKSIKIIGILFGAFLIIWFLLPPNYAPSTGGFHFSYISYLFATIYCVPLYLYLSIKFYNLSKNSEDQQKKLFLLFLGNLFWVFVFFWKLIQIFAFRGLLWAALVGYIAYIIAITGYFLGAHSKKERKE